MSTNIETLQLAALFGKTRRRVLGALCSAGNEPQFLRQIARQAASSAGTVRRELLSLTAAGIVIQDRRSRQILYRLNPALSFVSELKSIFHKTSGIADALKRALEPLHDKVKLGFIYGSAASGTGRPGSDLDVALVGSLKVDDALAALGPLQLDLGREINPAVFPEREFKNKIANGSPFLTRIWQGPKIVLTGDLREFEPA